MTEIDTTFHKLPAALLLATLVLLSSAAAAQTEIVGHAKAVSGDTVRIKSIENGKVSTIRLFGVDAIELNQHCETKLGVPKNCGRFSRDALGAMLRRKLVTCVDFDRGPDGEKTATCYAGDVILNAAIVRAGWALAFSFDTNDYQGLENLAKKEGRGNWPYRFQKPWNWRADRADEQKGN
ncbi:MAG: nuclease [Rhodospirillaceae bacterium]|nr:nuclease [Rhodospirillaceae bacterium]